MSIPPLVCSTPPPPEQCEDDKDHEDFDIAYNLSQEDDDEDSTEYNYGNYSGYNIYPPKSEQSEKDKWPLGFNEDIQKGPNSILKPDEIPSSDNLISNDDNLISNESIKFDDNVLEDLNLKVDSENIHSSDTPTKEYETEAEIYNNECPDKSSMIQDEGGTDIAENVEEKVIDSPKVFTIGSNVTDGFNFESESLGRKSEESSDELSDTILEDKISTIKTESYVLSDCIQLKDEQKILETVVESNNNNFKVEQQSNIEEFEDFDDFQFTQSDTTQAVPATTENPWDNNADESSDFGDFKANFDNVSTAKVEDDTSNTHKEVTTDDCDDIDDFGDFDDFKSVNNVEVEDKVVTSTNNVPVLNFHSSENELQIVDSINNVLSTIFSDELPETENYLDGKLELFLNETWGHLIDVDVRQPYIINWNNSLGQKTLLKALCIDSRNILFGPKWSYNTPKYATNLSAAPLQPKKQVQSNTSNPESTEKVSSKETASWVDPFTPDGQESCSTDNDVKKTDTVKRPTDLDVLSSEPATNLNKIYSSTINVQPIRHINLPDTHIFTPTNSETPRSKTIHYDSGPPLVPQQVLEPATSQADQNISQPSTVNENDNDYWEFQDFKSTVTEVSTSSANKVEEHTDVGKSLSSNSTEKAGITYQTQILQPIKLEPIIPTLNWPDPGEVKETFTDFSEFVSSTSWNEKDKTNSENNVVNVDNKHKDHSVAPVPPTDDVEDEFKTFQSAPISSLPLDIGTTFISTQNLTCNNLSNEIKSTDKNTQIKKDSLTEPNIVFVENKGLSPRNTLGLQDDPIMKTSVNNSANHINSDILLPISSSSSTTARSQHNTGQILQPLSLESYSQINWPNPGIDLQDLSRFNPMNSLNSLKYDKTAGSSKVGSPAHNSANTVNHEMPDDDIWGEFVSNVPKTQQTSPKKNITFADDDEWTDFVSSPSIKPQNGLNTISLNVHTNSSMQKTVNQNKFASGSNQIQLDIPTLNYITPKSNSRGKYMDKHFQNL